jgi:septal ring factor EnvC (AmiA/AmiB activator)
MDFGISVLLDRLERDYPRRAKAMVHLLSLTVVVTCLGIIVAALTTAYTWIAGTLGESGWGNVAWTVSKVAFGVLALATLSSVVASALETRRRLDRVRELQANVENNLNRFETQRARIEGILADALTRVEAEQAEVEAQRASPANSLTRVEAQQAYVTQRTEQLRDMANGLFEQAKAFDERQRKP